MSVDATIFNFKVNRFFAWGEAMSDWNRFWVPESQIPPTEILLIFVILHILLITYLIFTYFFIRSKFNRSTKEYANLPEVSPILNRSLSLMYLGLGLIAFDDFLTHFIALVSRRDAYFSIGSASIFIIIGFSIFFINVSKFVSEVILVPQSFNPKPLPFIRTMKYAYALSFSTIIILQLMDLDIRILSELFVTSSGLMGIFLTSEFYLMFKTQTIDPVNRLRTLLAGFIGFGMIALLFFAANFVPPKDTLPANWPTRDAHVEILIFGTDLWVFFTSTMIVLIVTLPRSLRLIFEISDEEFNLYRDERMDLEWDKISQWDLKDAVSNVHSNEIEKIAFIDPIINELETDITELLPSIEIPYKFSLVDFRDEYAENYLKDRGDIVIVTMSGQSELQDIFKLISNDYDFNLQYHQYLQVNSFVYKLNGYSCSMIVCIPSYWNNNRKLWIILANKQNAKQTLELYNKYYSFLTMIADEEQLFMVIKFPYKGNLLQSIPSISTDNAVPDFRNLIFL